MSAYELERSNQHLETIRRNHAKSALLLRVQRTLSPTSLSRSPHKVSRWTTRRMRELIEENDRLRAALRLALDLGDG